MVLLTKVPIVNLPKTATAPNQQLPQQNLTMILFGILNLEVKIAMIQSFPSNLCMNKCMIYFLYSFPILILQSKEHCWFITILLPVCLLFSDLQTLAIFY